MANTWETQLVTKVLIGSTGRIRLSHSNLLKWNWGRHPRNSTSQLHLSLYNLRKPQSQNIFLKIRNNISNLKNCCKSQLSHWIHKCMLFEKSENSFKIQESSSSPEKYFGNRKKYILWGVFAPAVSQRQRFYPRLPFQNGGWTREKSLGSFRI